MLSKIYKNKNSGEFNAIGKWKEKVTVYKSSSGKTATFKNSKKIDKK